MLCSRISGWRSRGYLPHFDAVGVAQHIVFRLADALPRTVLEGLEAEPSAHRLRAADQALDAGAGSRALADPRIAAMVRDALRHFDARRYRLTAWCVMPTHVHVLVETVADWPTSLIVQAWKSFTARQANRVLCRSGRFWAPEYFDRTMRDAGEVARTVDYIERNPVAAGLCSAPDQWPWSSGGGLDGARGRRYRPRSMTAPEENVAIERVDARL